MVRPGILTTSLVFSLQASVGTGEAPNYLVGSIQLAW
jgi:hypothetical protein